jgi:lipopolysaccharide/colanic/teichoic acid biosynthesis glycosyltransferase
MPLAKLLALSRRLFLLQPRPLGSFQGLHGPEQTRLVLGRERARADRNGDRVSVVTFVCPSGPVWDYLVPVFKRRLRATDEIGWMGPERLCIVLPGTDDLGAAKVIESVLEQLPADAPIPTTTIYTYPSDDRPPPPPQRPEALPAAPPASPVAALEMLFLQALPRWKRALDVFGAATGLVVLSPVFLGIALAVKLSSPGPVFFGQWRSGRGGKPFWMWKFRSMVHDAEDGKKELLDRNEQDGPAFKIKHDPRVTRLGRFLRATSLDELPQLWNVLKGEMSLVGPRPLPCAETEGCVSWQRQRLDVTPGLTCIWQVRGRSTVSFAEWMRMDVQYVRTCSLGHDLKLLVLTVPAVLLRRGAH